MNMRYEIVKKAREYIGTRFRHQGRKKGGSVDCVGLLACVAQELGISDYDRKVYSSQPTEGLLVSELKNICEEIPIEEAGPGDVLVFWISRKTKRTQHAGIMTDKGMIHAYQKVRKVVEHGLDDKWKSRLCTAFRFPGVV